MKSIGLILTLLMFSAPASAQALRCPIGFHRNIVGRCIPNFIQGRHGMGVPRHRGPTRRPYQR